MSFVTSFDELEEKLVQKDVVFGKRDTPEKNKAKKKPPQELYNLREKLQFFIPQCIATMIKIILDPNEETKDRIRCIENILNRYDGRPTERVEIKTTGELENMSAREISDRLMAIVGQMPSNGAKKLTISAAMKEAKTIKSLG